MSGLDFHKGCYLGQELTIRTHHTGVVRKRLMPVQYYNISSQSITETLTLDKGSPQLAPTTYTDITNSKGKKVGMACGGIYNIGLALVRLEHAYPLQTEPLSLQINESVGLRAFIPSLWPESIRNPIG